MKKAKPEYFLDEMRQNLELNWKVSDQTWQEICKEMETYVGDGPTKYWSARRSKHLKELFKSEETLNMDELKIKISIDYQNRTFDFEPSAKQLEKIIAMVKVST